VSPGYVIAPAPRKFGLSEARFIGRLDVARRLHRRVRCYKASHLRSSFEAQLHLYESKIGQAEIDLQAMVFQEGWRER
jgi:hypothetical protein